MIACPKCGGPTLHAADIRGGRLGYLRCKVCEWAGADPDYRPIMSKAACPDCGGRLEHVFGTRTDADGQPRATFQILDPRKMLCPQCWKMVEVWPPTEPLPTMLGPAPRHPLWTPILVLFVLAVLFTVVAWGLTVLLRTGWQ